MQNVFTAAVDFQLAGVTVLKPFVIEVNFNVNR